MLTLFYQKLKPQLHERVFGPALEFEYRGTETKH